MRRLGLVLGIVAGVLVLANPALAGNWGANWGSMIWGSVAAVPSVEGVGVWLLVISLFGAAAWRLRRRSTHVSLVLVLLPLLPLLMAPHYTNWNGFVNGEVADATKVNDNFIAAAAALDDNDARLAALEAATQSLVAATQMFLTTNACPAGYGAVEEGYIKLGAGGLTTIATPRTLTNPGHAHSYSLQSDQHAGEPVEVGSPPLHGGSSVFELYLFSGPQFSANLNAHSHAITGSVGSGPVSGDATQDISGDLEHIRLRLCVRSS